MRFKQTLLLLVLISFVSTQWARASETTSTIRLKNLYVGNSFDTTLSTLSVFRAITAAGLTLPLVGAIAASFKGPACDKARKLIEGLSSEGARFTTSKCYDARKLAWDTALTGKSNWGFETRLELRGSLESGERVLPGVATDVSERSLDIRIARCVDALRVVSQLTVPAGDVDSEKGYTHAFEIRGGCNVRAGGGVELTLEPVVYVN